MLSSTPNSIQKLLENLSTLQYEHCGRAGDSHVDIGSSPPSINHHGAVDIGLVLFSR